MGRSRLSLESRDLLDAYKELGSWRLVADRFGVSIRTIFRRLKDDGLKISKSYS